MFLLRIYFGKTCLKKASSLSFQLPTIEIVKKVRSHTIRTVLLSDLPHWFEERFARDYDVTYFGYSGDGHIDRLNLTTSFYYAYGEQTSARFKSEEEKIDAYFFAIEGSMDFDWFRPTLSFLYASGDDDPF